MRLRSVWLAVVVCGMVGLAYGQTCRLQWNTEQSCLDISQLNGERVVLPSNVTRLGHNGLALCALESESSQIPAVLFIMDQSASMDSTFAGIPAGDPLHWRGDLVRNAISYLNEKSNGSGWFAYVEFAGDTTEDLQPPHKDCIADVNDGAEYLLTQDFLPLSDSVVDVWSQKATSPVQNRCNTGTNYFAALDKAKRYAAGFNPGDIHAEVSVIFVSDGRPNRRTGDTYAPLDSDYEVPGVFPPVHGIFLGGEGTGDGDDLAEVADRTDGSYTLVDPKDKDGMTSVMNRIIDQISRVSLPDSVVLRVNGVAYPSSRVQGITGAYQVAFPQDIPLSPGENEVEMTVEYTDTATGLPRTRITSFVLAVEGPAADTGLIEIDQSFSAYCAIGNSLQVDEYLNPGLVVGATLAQTPRISLVDGSSLDLFLTAAGYSGEATSIRVQSRRTGDAIGQNLEAADGLGEFAGTLSMVLAQQSVLGSVRPADSTDAVFHVAAFDTLEFRWQNPEDPRDTIVASILIYETPRVKFMQDTLFINQVGCNVWDGAAAGARVPVEYSWLTGEYVASATLQRLDSSRTFQGVSDQQTTLLAERSDRIVVRYLDPLYKIEYLDTAYLVFDVPEIPVAWMLDEDGDGRADMLQLTFLSQPPPNQHLPDIHLRWGERSQDSVFFRVDSLNPRISLDVVQIHMEGSMQQWRFPLPTPFPLGHTTGSGELGEGSLIMKGWFNSRNVEFVVPVVDKVGPILLEMWVDGKTENVAYFTASEPLGQGASTDWVLTKRGTSPESQRNTQVQDLDPQTAIYKLTLVNRDNNRIFSRDSARFIPQTQGGPRDRGGNGAAPENPFVEVKGATPADNGILVAYKQALVRSDVAVTLPPSTDDEESENKFRVLVMDPATGKYVLPGSKEAVNQRFAEAMPSLGITVTLPQVSGFDQDGQPLRPEEGVMVWNTTVNVRAMFYDQQGQFVARRSMDVETDDPSVVGRDGTVNLAFVWEVDSKKGLVAYSGRAVGSGVLLSKVTINMKSEASMDLVVYDRAGEVDEGESFKTGDVLRKKKEFIARLGYLRKK